MKAKNLEREEDWTHAMGVLHGWVMCWPVRLDLTSLDSLALWTCPVGLCREVVTHPCHPSTHRHHHLHHKLSISFLPASNYSFLNLLHIIFAIDTLYIRRFNLETKLDLPSLFPPSNSPKTTFFLQLLYLKKSKQYKKY